jgi:glycosyltransferase involved in cell wall biosynthesis
MVVGSHRWGEDLLTVLERFDVRQDILLTGPVPAEDLPALYAGAECFVFPSRYEGFGLPVLEAMACGTPVIVSNRGALPEVVGQAGVLVDPEDPIALAAAMCQVTGDLDLRRRLVAAGLAQAARFSWTESARDLLSLLQKVADGGREDA